MQESINIDNEERQTLSDSQASSDGVAQQLIVMTGATSGLGSYALRQMASHPATLIIVGARGNRGAVPEGIACVPLYLASLESVRNFAATVLDLIGDIPIDILILNAGVRTRGSRKRSADGFELNFAVNHLSHYLLTRLLMPNMAERSRVIFTTDNGKTQSIGSDTLSHFNPKSLANPKWSWLGTGSNAYRASKICNLLTACSFASSEEVRRRQISVLAINPGPTSNTSLGRDRSRIGRLVKPFKMIMSQISSLLQGTRARRTPRQSGYLLALVAMGKINPPDGKIYISVSRGKVNFPDIPNFEKAGQAQERLWRESASMVGIK